MKVWNLWEQQKGWGWNDVVFSHWESRRISGHHPHPEEWQVGDEVRTRMESGQIARFEVMEVKRCWDPWDMFFLTVKDIGYLDAPYKNL